VSASTFGPDFHQHIPLSRSHHEALKLVLEIIRKIGREKEKANELGFQVVVAILSPLSLYGGNRKMKLPLLHNTRIHAPEGHFGNSRRSTIGRMPATATCLASTQALRSQRVSSTLKSLDALGSCLRPLSLRSWLCGSTKEPRRFCGEPP
jgi:hypothetical protein